MRLKLAGAYDAQLRRIATNVYERRSPFGNRITNTGPQAPLCPVGFSSKSTDEETGLVYYALRYCSAEMGSLVNRDPI